MNDELKELLEKLDLSEETAIQIQGLLEAAMKAAKEEGEEEGKKKGKEEAEAEAEEEKEALEESHAAEIAFLKEKAEEYGAYLKGKANEYGEVVKESVSEKMKEYADYAVEQFIAENKERFVETEEYARMRSAFDYIKEAFEKNAFDVREDAHVVELQESLTEATKQYEDLFEDLALAREELENAKRELILERATADLADTQKEKVVEMLEAVSFDSFEEYEEGIAMIVEQAKGVAEPAAPQEELLKENFEEEIPSNMKKVDDSVASYLSRPGLF